MIDFSPHLPKRPQTDPQYVPELVECMLSTARERGASDLHLVPTASGLEMKWRIDGVLQSVRTFPSEIAPRVVARLKILSQLLTYQSDMPQEGRIREPTGNVEMRVSTFPTLFGEKAVVRMFVGSGKFRMLDELGLAPEILDRLRLALAGTSGLILLAGPAGSGKTTTVYASLRELVDKSGAGRSLVSLEDPIEAVVEGVSQSQVNIAAGFTLDAGLRSLVRQDPEVLLVGEIRDRATAEIVFQAALTGHLVLTTFHAGSAAGAIGRLSDMGIEPYLLRSGLRTIVCQRLVRKLCHCATPLQEVSETGSVEAEQMGLRVKALRTARGCNDCQQTGYRGRMVLAEMLQPEATDLGRAILSRGDTAELHAQAEQAGMVSLEQRGIAAVEAGLTTPAEIRRVLGMFEG